MSEDDEKKETSKEFAMVKPFSLEKLKKIKEKLEEEEEGKQEEKSDS